jgi:hypothetical protein
MKTLIVLTLPERALTAPQFHSLTEAPLEIEWFANITNSRTWAVYEFEVRLCPVCGDSLAGRVSDGNLGV